MIEHKLEWTSSDAKMWKDFLSTQTGNRLLAQLAAVRPTLFPSGDTNSILIRSGESRQHDAIVAELLGLAGGAIELDHKDPEAYPSLTDDAAWEDGKTTTPNLE